MRLAIVSAGLLIASAAHADPVAARPVVPWRRELAGTRTMLEFTGTFGGGTMLDDGAALMAFARLGVGITHLQSDERVTMVIVHAEEGRFVGLRAGASYTGFPYGHGVGATIGLDTGGADLGVAIGPCFTLACIELRTLGLFADEYRVTATLTIAVPFHLFGDALRTAFRELGL